MGLSGQTTFGVELAVILVIQAPERRGQPTQSQDQAELRSAELDDQAETHPLGKCEAVFAFRLHFREWIPGRQTNRDQLIPAVRSKSEVADPIRSIERAPHKFTSASGVLRPRQHGRTHVHPDSSLVARQATFLDQVIAQLAEPKAVLVIVESRPGEHGKPDVGKTRRVAVAVLEAECHQAANDE